jgi:putative ABC transport system permease protein
MRGRTITMARQSSKRTMMLSAIPAAALQTILFKVKPLDPTIYLTVAGLLTLVAAISCFVPARRATRVNPMEALRTE